jgi:hypothetical protein
MPLCAAKALKIEELREKLKGSCPSLELHCPFWDVEKGICPLTEEQRGEIGWCPQK